MVGYELASHDDAPHEVFPISQVTPLESVWTIGPPESPLHAPVPADELPTQMDCGVMLVLPQTDLQTESSRIGSSTHWRVVGRVLLPIPVPLVFPHPEMMAFPVNSWPDAGRVAASTTPGVRVMALLTVMTE